MPPAGHHQRDDGKHDGNFSSVQAACGRLFERGLSMSNGSAVSFRSQLGLLQRLASGPRPRAGDDIDYAVCSDNEVVEDVLIEISGGESHTVAQTCIAVKTIAIDAVDEAAIEDDAGHRQRL